MYKIYSYLSIFSLVVPLLAGTIKFKTLSAWLRVLFIYVIMSALTEILSLAFSKGFKTGYFITQNIFTLLEFLLLISIYYLESDNKIFKKVILIITSLYTAFTIYDFFSNTNGSLPDMLASIESFIFISLSVYFFYKIQNELLIPSLYQYSYYWFNTAVLFYFATSLILFFCGDYLDRCERDKYELIWGLHLTGNIIYNLMIGVSLWKTKLK